MQLATEDAIGHGSLLERVRTYALVDRPHDPLAGAPPRTAMHWRGRLRLSPGGTWWPFSAAERIDIDAPSFSWDARVHLAPLVTLKIHDGMVRGTALTTLRLWNALPLGRSSGKHLDEGAAYRMLAELPWAPRGFLGAAGVRFTEADGRLWAAWSDVRFAASVSFDVRSDGSVRTMMAAGRPRQRGRAFIATPWSGTYDDYAQLGRFRVPTRTTVTWHLRRGPFTWLDARLVDFTAH